jgi:hypothetical protein
MVRLLCLLKPHLYIRSAPSHGTMAKTEMFESKYVYWWRYGGTSVYRRAENLEEEMEHVLNDKTSIWLEKWRLTWILEYKTRGIVLSFSATVWGGWGEWGDGNTPRTGLWYIERDPLSTLHAHVPGLLVMDSCNGAWRAVATTEDGTSVSIHQADDLGKKMIIDIERMHVDVQHGNVTFGLEWEEWRRTGETLFRKNERVGRRRLGSVCLSCPPYSH